MTDKTVQINKLCDGNSGLPEAEKAPGPFSVLSIRDYRFLVISNLATFAGYQIRNMGQAWIVLDKTGSEALMGLVNAMPGIAIISISLIGGALADRSERWQLLWRTKVIIASMALLTAVLLTTDFLEWWHLVPISLITGTMFALYSPTSQAYAVDIVGRDRLVAASSLNTGISTTATILGPTIGGALLVLGFDVVFYVLTGIYLFSALMIFSVRKRSAPAPSGNMLSEIRDGIVYGYRTPIIRSTLFVSLSALAIGVYQPAIPVKVQQELGLGTIGYGTMLAMNGIGSLAGAVLLFSFSSRIRKGRLLIFGLLLFYSSVALFAISTTFIFASMAMIMLGFAFSAWMISVPVLLQTASSENMRGRVMSLYFMTVLTYQLGWLIGGAAIQLWGIQTTLFLGIAGGVIIAAPTIILTPELRRAK